MGNVVETTTGGPSTSRTDEFSSIQQSAPASSSGGETSSINKDLHAPYRRYYPKSAQQFSHHQHASTKLPTPSSSSDFFRNSCPLFEQASPLRKRLRANAGAGATTATADETFSLPTAPLWSSTPPTQSPYSRFNRNSAASSNKTTPMSTSVPSSNLANVGNDRRPSTGDNDEIVIDDDDVDEASTANESLRKSSTLPIGVGGPITKAVISRGLRARFKSFSAWLLSEPAKETAVSFSALLCPNQLSMTSYGSPRPSVLRVGQKGPKHKRRVRFQFSRSNPNESKENGKFLTVPITASFPNSASFPSGFGGSLKRWSSLRASFSFGNSSKLRREASHHSASHTPSKSSSRRPLPQNEGTLGQNSVASLNSLSDGRTPWPVPWLEAIFLPEFPSKGTVNEKAFTTVGTIAKGAFGKVYRVSLKASPEKIFAMKVQSKSDVITQNAIQQIKDEVSIHQTFAEYPFIAQLYCTWQSRSKLYIVLQYVAGYGDLYQLWRDEGPFSEDAARIWGAELAMAIDFMHANGVIYRDLKMENIMLDDDGHVQLVDFGLAKWLYYGDRTSTICGTLQYMAPEVLQGEMYNHAADWWSLGVLLHTLMVGSYPYSGADSHTSVKIDDYAAPASLSVEAQTLLSKLLRKDPNWRLRSFTVYKTQPFFKGISFDAIRNKTLHPFDYIPRMRRCNTCNVVSEDLEGLEDSDLAMFQEDYEALKNFDSFCGDDKL